MVKLAKSNTIAKENPKNLSYKEEMEQQLAFIYAKYADPESLFLSAYFQSLVGGDHDSPYTISCYSWTIWEILNGFRKDGYCFLKYDNDLHCNLCKTLKGLIKGFIDEVGCIDTYDQFHLLSDLLYIFDFAERQKGEEK